MTEPALWSCGVLGKVHGLHGELYLKLSPDGLERLQLGTSFFLARDGVDGVRPCVVERAGGDDRRPLVRLDLAATREEAIALQGCELLAAGDALQAQPHYRVSELLGRTVATAAGRALGTVSDVVEAPAHEILVVRAPDDSELLLPLVDEVVALDDEGVVRIVDGLLDEPAGESTGSASRRARSEER